IIEQYKPSYTLPMNELITKMMDLKQDSIVNKDFEKFLAMIEKLLGGKIGIKSNQIGQKELNLNISGSNSELPMFLVSSNTNQLATLYLYFKYWIKSKEKNFLILDEPEENLHPKNQYDLMSILIEFASQNNKLLLTTHSTLLTKIINNYINYAQLTDENKAKIQSEHLSSSLNIKDIEICFFDGEQVKHYTIEEYGVVFKDFLEIENQIASLSNEINMKLYEQWQSN
ncbi:MAG TPA: ATP-binding protein, partial [Epsilonproteobacteria bacterium]|nr:ATP-binding protein [Campylobacterota bacterium]